MKHLSLSFILCFILLSFYINPAGSDQQAPIPYNNIISAISTKDYKTLAELKELYIKQYRNGKNFDFSANLGLIEFFLPSKYGSGNFPNAAKYWEAAIKTDEIKAYKYKYPGLSNPWSQLNIYQFYILTLFINEEYEKCYAIIKKNPPLAGKDPFISYILGKIDKYFGNYMESYSNYELARNDPDNILFADESEIKYEMLDIIKELSYKKKLQDIQYIGKGINKLIGEEKKLMLDNYINNGDFIGINNLIAELSSENQIELRGNKAVRYVRTEAADNHSYKLNKVLELNNPDQYPAENYNLCQLDDYSILYSKSNNMYNSMISVYDSGKKEIFKEVEAVYCGIDDMKDAPCVMYIKSDGIYRYNLRAGHAARVMSGNYKADADIKALVVNDKAAAGTRLFILSDDNYEIISLDDFSIIYSRDGIADYCYDSLSKKVIIADKASAKVLDIATLSVKDIFKDAVVVKQMKFLGNNRLAIIYQRHFNTDACLKIVSVDDGLESLSRTFMNDIYIETRDDLSSAYIIESISDDLYGIYAVEADNELKYMRTFKSGFKPVYNGVIERLVVSDDTLILYDINSDKYQSLDAEMKNVASINDGGIITKTGDTYCFYEISKHESGYKWEE